MNSLKMKTIVYRGGVVRFRIPADWEEEYDDYDGGTFYAPGEDTGTFRLKVILAAAPPGRTLGAGDLHEFLTRLAQEHEGPIQPLRPDVAMIRFDVSETDRDTAIKIRYWTVAQVLPPRHIRSAQFSYTLLAQQFDQPCAHQEMDMLEREILAAQFAPIVGK